MKRPRPYIPLSVRIEVAARQLNASPYGKVCDYVAWVSPATNALSEKRKLGHLLRWLFRALPHHLDHDPPLRARAFNPRTGKYKPDANDPRFLIYRSKEDHRVKTFVRGEHGQYSDTILIARERKREKKKAGKLPTYRWPKRKMRNGTNALFRRKIR